MKTAVIALLSGVLALAAGEGKPEKLNFKNYGFSINALDAQPADGMVLSMMLPAQEGFSANVNVLMQPLKSTMAEYRDVSKNGLVQANLTLVQEKLDGDVLVIEYTGQVSGRSLHWYAKALKSGDKVYLATATCLESQWAQSSPKLKACVDSFSVPDAGAKPASAPAARATSAAARRGGGL